MKMKLKLMKEIKEKSEENFMKNNINSLNLIKELLMKCEAKNLFEIYKKILEKNNGIITLEELSKLNNYFTKNNIEKDIKNFDNILKGNIFYEVIKIINYPKIPNRLNIFSNEKLKKNNLKIKQKEDLIGVECLFLAEKLKDIINIYYKKGYIPKMTKLDYLFNKLSIDEYNKELFKKQLKKFSDEGVISTILKEDYLIFVPKILHPTNRHTFIELILTLIIGLGLIISIYIFLIKFINWK